MDLNRIFAESQEKESILVAELLSTLRGNGLPITAEGQIDVPAYQKEVDRHMALMERDAVYIRSLVAKSQEITKDCEEITAKYRR